MDLLLKHARATHAAGRPAEAAPLYERVLALVPRNYDANYLLGIALYQQGQAARSVPFLTAAAKIRPEALEAQRDLAIILLQLGETGAAEARLRSALALDPRNPQLLVNRGIALRQLGRSAESAICHRAALAIRPQFAEAHHHLGNSLLALGKPEEALASFRQAAVLKPDFAEALQGAGQALLDLGRTDEAIDQLGQAARTSPASAEAQRALGVALLRAERNEEALAALAEALAIDPRNADALTARGIACERRNDLAEALASYRAALDAMPGNVDAMLGEAAVLRRSGLTDEAIAAYDRAIARAPERGDAYHGAGLAFFARREFAAAARSFDAAIRHMPGASALHYQRARTLRELDLPADALDAVDKALALEPGLIDACLLKAQILSLLHRPEEALAALEAARALEPDADRGLDQRFSEKMRICRWDDYDGDLTRILARLEADGETTSAFQSLAYLEQPDLQRRCAEANAAEIAADALPRRPMELVRRDGRTAIGYFSGDFRDHAMMYLMADLFAQHDRRRFRIIAFSLTSDRASAMRARVQPLFDAFHDVNEMSDREIIDLARREEIDIAADLMGFTRHSRPSLFASGVAPIQVNYLGYPGTTGMTAMDYIVADPLLIPAGLRQHYSEKIGYLPDCYQPNDRQRAVSDKAFTREELGLPHDAFVYCCFNNSFKITPTVFACWMRILRATPRSVLWLFSHAPAVEKNLREAARARGVDPARLIFAKGLPLEEHLARHRAADLFLDTLPYGAHTTASDALWAGLPLLTLMGETFASRVAASLLTAAGLPDLIAASRDDYERMAIDLYNDRQALAALRGRLAANRLNCALFDTPRYARNLEALFVRMIERRQRGLAPDHLLA